MTVANRRLADGELEALVLDALWSSDEWLMPGEVLERIRPQHPLAYSSVMTVLVRLWNKDIVDRRPQGRGFGYRPVQTREELVAARMRQLLDTSEDHGTALAHFLDGMGTGDRRRLRSLLARGRREP